MPRTEFFGVILSAQEMYPDPAKVEAIKKSRPANLCKGCQKPAWHDELCIAFYP